MAEDYCDYARWQGEIIEEEKCDDAYTLADGKELPCCKIAKFAPNSNTKPDSAYPERYYDDGAWEIYFEDTPRVIHAWSDGKDCLKPHLEVTRVVECRCNICGPPDDRFEYIWPEGCPFTILPPGRYRVRVPDQRVYNMEKGDKTAVNVMLEVVNSQFVQAIQAMPSASSCGGMATVNNCCG